MKKELLDEQMVKVEGGEALTLSAVLSVLVIGIVAVMCYRIFMSEKEIFLCLVDISFLGENNVDKKYEY